jgi:hypothetical protein
MSRPLLRTACLIGAAAALLLAGLPARRAPREAPWPLAGRGTAADSVGNVPEARAADLRFPVPWEATAVGSGVETQAAVSGECRAARAEDGALRAELERLERALRAARAALTPDQRGEWTGRLAGRRRPEAVSPQVLRLLALTEQRDRLAALVSHPQTESAAFDEDGEPSPRPSGVFEFADDP